jgi:hypothetical protein
MDHTATVLGTQQDKAAAHAAARELKPFGHAQEQLCRLVKQEKSSVIILTGGGGCGKTTLIPAVVANSGPDLKCVVAHPNLLAVRTAYKWMTWNQENRFAGGNMSGRVELVKLYKQGDFGNINHSTTILTYTTDSILSDYITNDLGHGLLALARYTVVFLDEIHVRSLAIENILLRVKGIMEKRDAQKSPIHFVLSSTSFDSTQLKAFFEIRADHIVNLEPRNDGGSPGITHHYTSSTEAGSRVEQVVAILDKHVADRLEAKKKVGILVFLTKREMRAVETFYRETDRHYVGIRFLFLSESTDGYYQDEAINSESKIVFCTDTISIGLTVLHVDTAIISDLKDAAIWDADAGQLVYASIEVSASDVEQQARIISKVSSRGECFYLFTRDTLKDMSMYRLSELDIGDCLEYILMLYGLYPDSMPIAGEMNLITYPQMYHVHLQTSRLRALGLICAHPLGNGYHPTEIGHRVIKMPAVNGPARILLGYLEPDATYDEFWWHVNISCLLTFNDRQILTKRTPSSHLSDGEMDILSPLVKDFGEIMIEFACLNTCWNKMFPWKEEWNRFLLLNFSVVSPAFQIQESIRTHFGRRMPFTGGPSPTPEWTSQFVGILCRVLQWNLGVTARSEGGDVHIKHYASGHMFIIDPKTLIDWDKHWVDDGIDMVYLKLSKIGSKYIASRFCPVLKPSKDVFLKSQKLENKTPEQLGKYLAIGMTPSPK